MAGAAKTKKAKTGSGWSWRLAGIALCAFFALGVLTGLSPSGRLLARRVQALLSVFHAGRSELVPGAYDWLRRPPALRLRSLIGAVVLVEHQGAFYQLGADGTLRGPVTPVVAGDLPILSGAGVEDATPAQLLGYAAELVRGEAALSSIVSEMRVDEDGNATFFLERPAIAILIAPSRFSLELTRAVRVLALWHAHRELIESIDMRTPGQAIVRLEPGTGNHTDSPNRLATRGVNRAHPSIFALRREGPEVTASK